MRTRIIFQISQKIISLCALHDPSHIFGIIKSRPFKVRVSAKVGFSQRFFGREAHRDQKTPFFSCSRCGSDRMIRTVSVFAGISFKDKYGIRATTASSTQKTMKIIKYTVKRLWYEHKSVSFLSKCCCACS